MLSHKKDFIRIIKENGTKKIFNDEKCNKKKINCIKICKTNKWLIIVIIIVKYNNNKIKKNKIQIYINVNLQIVVYEINGNNIIMIKMN